MRWMIASDLHGSAFYTNLLISRFFQEGADRLLLLGDLLYHGPRNDLPKDYAPKEVLRLLNQNRDLIFCVRGNCDAEVDQMVLDFPLLTGGLLFPLDKRLIYATHGHEFNAEHLPPLKKGDILLHGHTHVPLCCERNGIYVLNPGSVSIPKENSKHSYMILTDNLFTWKELLSELEKPPFMSFSVLA